MKPTRRPSRAVPVLLLAVAAASCSDRLPTNVRADAAQAAFAAAPSQQAPPFVPGRLLVGLTPATNANVAAAAVGAAVERDLGLGVWLFNVPENAELAVAQALQANPNVRFAEPDFIRSFPTLQCAICTETGGGFMGYKWDLENTGVIMNASGVVLANTGVVGADMNWKPAFESLGADFQGSVLVAILDSGIRGDHEELTGRIAGGYNFNNNNSNWADDNGHGTHVAGTVGARAGNGTGMAGNAWGPNVRLLAVKVCGPTFLGYGCTDSAIYQGINWAVNQGAKVINMSLAGLPSSSSVRSALQNALSRNVLSVCAAGNESTSTVKYPAGFPECVAVSATNWSDGFSSYSNWGSHIDLSAPGGDVEHSSGYSYILSSYYSSATSYAFMAGTSMATPQVTGLAALLYAQGMTQASAVLQQIKNTADDLGAAGVDTRFGYGRINVGRAIEMLGDPGDPPPNQPPLADFSFSCTALTCSFTDTSTDADGQVTAWSWTFGDGASSTERNPTHAYAAEGSYTTTLTVTDDDAATGQQSKIVNLASSSAIVTAQFTYACTDLTCQFTNTSFHRDGVNLLANWDMGDGSEMRIEWSPLHTYAQPGSYEVIMVVLAEDFSGWSSARQTVTVPSTPPPPPPPTGPTAAFTHSCTWLVCTFTDASTAGSAPITSRSWSFGDGTPAGSGSSVEHTFASAGDYSVTLTVTDENTLSDGETQTVTVQASPPPPTGPTAAFTYTCTWVACTFTDASTAGSAAIASRSWSFGDGSPAGSGTSVEHTFAAAGTYDVVLSVTDANGLADDESQSITVETEPAISLSARGYKVKGRQTVDLTWSGAQSAEVVVLRNGAAVALRPNSTTESNTWTHSTTQTGGGTSTYQVCQAEGNNPTSVCSPTVQVVF